MASSLEIKSKKDRLSLYDIKINGKKISGISSIKLDMSVGCVPQVTITKEIYGKIDINIDEIEILTKYSQDKESKELLENILNLANNNRVMIKNKESNTVKCKKNKEQD